jgi:hypothetical protein
MATTEAVLKDFPLLYKGRRMLVIDNSDRHIDEDYDIIVWDRLLGCEVGFCRYESDGSICGWAEHGPNELTISGVDAKQLAQDATRVVSWSLKN